MTRTDCMEPRSELFDAAKEDIAKCIAKYAPLSAEQVLSAIHYAASIDLAIAAIDYGLSLNIDPNEALNAGRGSDVGTSPLLGQKSEEA